MPRILVDISAHGSGHLAQTGPVLAALAGLVPDASFTVRTGLPPDRLALRIGPDHALIASDDGFGLVMDDPLHVSPERSAARYLAIHRDLDGRIAALSRTISEGGYDLVLSNVGYIPLAAARAAGVPSVAMCSLNWHDVVGSYCGALPGMDVVPGDIRRCYERADQFLRLEPGLPMPSFKTTAIRDAAVAVGVDRRRLILDTLGRPCATRIVVFACEPELGPPTDPAFGNAASQGLLLLGPEAWAGDDAPFTAFSAAGVGFLDLLRSCDLVVAKPGYGIVTEAAAAGVPLLLTGRRDWPETASFVGWLEGRGIFSHRDGLPRDVTLEDIAGMMARAEPFAATAVVADGSLAIARRIVECAF